MTAAPIVFLSFAGVMAVLDWVAVARRIVVLEYVSKPAATVALFVTAATLDVARDASWGWLLAALVLCLAGDVFLMLPRDSFIPGLASFALAQVMLTLGFLADEPKASRLGIGLIVVAPLAAVLAQRFVRAIRGAGHADLVVPVMVYLVVICAMAVSAISAGSAVAIAGAMAFMVSDSLIAETRFVRERPWHGVAIMVTYHLALAGLVLGLA